MINIKFHFQNMCGIFGHWNTDGSDYYPNYYAYPLEGFIIYHMDENGKVVEDYIQQLSTYNIKEFETLFKFPDIKQATVLGHRKTNLKRIAQEQLFFAPRENHEPWERDYLFIRADLIGLEKVEWVKEKLTKEAVCFESNYRLQQICTTDYGVFKGPTECDCTEYSKIKSYYKEAMSYWHNLGPRGFQELEDKIKLYQLMIKDLKACMKRWETLEPNEIMQEHTYLLQDSKICLENFGVEDFWKGGDK